MGPPGGWAGASGGVCGSSWETPMVATATGRGGEKGGPANRRHAGPNGAGGTDGARRGGKQKGRRVYLYLGESGKPVAPGKPRVLVGDKLANESKFRRIQGINWIFGEEMGG